MISSLFLILLTPIRAPLVQDQILFIEEEKGINYLLCNINTEVCFALETLILSDPCDHRYTWLVKCKRKLNHKNLVKLLTTMCSYCIEGISSSKIFIDSMILQRICKKLIPFRDNISKDEFLIDKLDKLLLQRNFIEDNSKNIEGIVYFACSILSETLANHDILWMLSEKDSLSDIQQTKIYFMTKLKILEYNYWYDQYKKDCNGSKIDDRKVMIYDDTIITSESICITYKKIFMRFTEALLVFICPRIDIWISNIILNGLSNQKDATNYESIERKIDLEFGKKINEFKFRKIEDDLKNILSELENENKYIHFTVDVNISQVNSDYMVRRFNLILSKFDIKDCEVEELTHKLIRFHQLTEQMFRKVVSDTMLLLTKYTSERKISVYRK